jgi:hypothetical protein
MGHLIFEMLPEPQSFGIDPEPYKQLLRCVNEVCQHLVGYDLSFYRFSDRY